MENQIKFARMEGIPLLIKIVMEVNSRNKKIEAGVEEEFISNIINSICSCLLIKENQEIFYKSDGIRIMLGFLKENNTFRHFAVKVLDFALQDNKSNCRELVEADGLGSVFSYFMGKGFKMNKTKMSALIELGEEHCLGIMNSLIKFLKGVQMDRFMYKFKENHHEKCERLVDLYKKNELKTKLAEKEEEDEGEDDLNPRDYKIVNSGLFNLQLISLLIGFLMTRTDHKDINEKFDKILPINNISRDMIKSTLAAWSSHSGEEFESSDEFSSNKKFIEEIIKKIE
jgi:beta-catenin-like protein 1